MGKGRANPGLFVSRGAGAALFGAESETESPVAILLFTDFGADDLYVGQVEAMLDRYAPGVRVIDLLHEAPPFAVRASAHLLAALAQGLPRGHVFLGVVDPGVGSDRGAVVLQDRRPLVRGAGHRKLLGRRGACQREVAVAHHRAAGRACRLRSMAGTSSRPWRRPLPPTTSRTRASRPSADLAVRFDGDDLAEVIYVDHYGNCFTRHPRPRRTADESARRRPAASSRTRACSLTRSPVRPSGTRTRAASSRSR